MIILFILGLLLGAVSVMFALENVTTITVTFLQWQATSSVAVVVLFSILVGMIIISLILLPGSVSKYLQYKGLKKEIDRLKEELRKQKELTVFAKVVPPNEVVIAQIENGAIDDSD